MHNSPSKFSLRSLSRTRCSWHGAIAHLSLPSLLLARGRHHPFDEQSMHKNGANNFFTIPKRLAANYTRAGFRQTARARVSPSFLLRVDNKMQTSTTNGSSPVLLHSLTAFAKRAKNVSRHGLGRTRFQQAADAFFHDGLVYWRPSRF